MACCLTSARSWRAVVAVMNAVCCAPTGLHCRPTPLRQRPLRPQLKREPLASAARRTVPITRIALLEFLRSCRYAVQSSLHPSGAPQSAVVGIAVSDTFEIVFDTLATSRKGQNLRRRTEIAFVIGSLEGKDERTVQFEGRADEPTGAERARLTELYFG